MSFFESLNGGLETFFKELSKSKTVRKSKFKELEYTPLLFSSDYLEELADGANKEERDVILDYLYRFNNLETGEDEYLDLLEVKSYHDLEQDLINRVWR
jgi:hypothetical protein